MASRSFDVDRNAMVNASVDALDSGGNVKIYSGAQPAAGAAATGTLLATIALPSPTFGAAAAGVATANAISDVNASAGGEAGWYRVNDGSVDRWDGRCGATGSGAEMELNTTTLVSGEPVSVVSWTRTMPAG